MRELCELLENITEEGYTVLFGQYDGSDELYIRISKKGASIVGIVYDESMFLWQINELFEILKEKERNRSIIPRTGKEKSLENGARKV